MIVIDIETYPNLDLIPLLPPVEPNKTLKDPVKVAEDISKKKKEQVEKMALDALFGKIACIGYYGDSLKEVHVGTEKEMIETLLGRLDNMPDMYFTWNGMNFDFPFISKRAAILGICSLRHLKRYSDKYKAENHIDLMVEFAGYNQYLKLDTAASVILGAKKVEFDVKEIASLLQSEAGKEKLKEYCLQDCKLVYDLAKKLGY